MWPKKNVKTEREYTYMIFVDVEESDPHHASSSAGAFKPTRRVLFLALPLQHLFIVTLTAVVKSSQMQ